MRSEAQDSYPIPRVVYLIRLVDESQPRSCFRLGLDL